MEGQPSLLSLAAEIQLQAARMTMAALDISLRLNTPIDPLPAANNHQLRELLGDIHVGAY